MTDTLAKLAHEFELIDPSAIVLARTDVPPRQAMEELRRDYPRAFKPPFDARTASPAEAKARFAQLCREQDQRAMKAQGDEALQRTLAKLGIKG